jgi:hypothetical protein
LAAGPALDVFVSYAHADNGVPLGSSLPHGWVTAFATNLNQGPNALAKRIFIDHQLRPGDNFSRDLLNKVKRSTLLVLLLSQNYVDSSWCGAEVEHFIRTHGEDAANPGGVIVVELFPYERLTDIPPVIGLLRKRLIHAKFWFQRPDDAEPSLAGYPSPLESGPDGSAHYWRVLNDVRMTIDQRLRTARAAPARPGAVDANTPGPQSLQPARSRPKEELGTVLLADTTDDLEARRNDLKLRLQAEGVVVVPDGDYVGLSPDEFEREIGADLARAFLFVQLLSPTVGRKPHGFDGPLPQMQFQRAHAADMPVMQWCARLPGANEIADPAHARLFDTDTVRVTHLADFGTAVIERLRAMKRRREQAATPPGDATTVAPARPHPRQIFIDDLAGDPVLNDQVRSIVRQQDYAVRTLPAGAPLGNNGVDVKEVLRPCSAGITIYSDRRQYAATYSRLVHFLNQVAEGNLPMERWGVYMQQGTVKGEFGIDSDEVVPIDESGLTAFLRGL